jgi:branched-chain amino acid transport system permease protein
MAEVMQIFLNCLVLSANYILLAVGLTLIFGILRTLNFAHGALYTVGAYVVYVLFGLHEVNYFLSILIAMIIVGIIGLLIEAALLFPLAQKVKVASLGAILGMILVIEGALSFIGSFFSGTVDIFGAVLSVERIMVVILCGLVMLIVYVWIQKTKQGVAIRALAENPRVANMQGINTRRIRFLVMGIACGLAAFAGSVVTPLFYINPYIGGNIVFKALLIVAVGGMGSIEGSIIAGLLIGFVECIGVTLIGPIAEIASFIIVIFIFIFKPRGLKGVEYEFH